MEELEQPQPQAKPRRVNGFLFVVALLFVAAATWGAVALAAGSGSAPNTDSSAPAASYFRGGQSIASPGGGDPNCPEHDRGSTTPSTPSTPSSTDGSTNPSL